MENAETAKEWFVTHEGKQFGPVSFVDLKFEVERGELNPRLDMVWKKDMDDWIPAGELKGLFEKNEEAEAEEKKKAAPAVIVPLDQKSDAQREKESNLVQGRWPGAGRGSYFFIAFVFPFLFAVGVGAARSAVHGKLEPDLIENIYRGLLLLPVIIAIVVTLKRFQNLGMTRWWFFGQFIPLLNFWVQYRIFACPPGYAVHRKLDGVGWLLAIIYWLLVLIGIALIAAVIYAVSQASVDLEALKTHEDFLEVLKKTYAPK